MFRKKRHLQETPSSLSHEPLQKAAHSFPQKEPEDLTHPSPLEEIHPSALKEPQHSGWFSRLKHGLKRSSEKLSQEITAIVKKRKLDDSVLEHLEEVLISADLGVPLAQRLTQRLRKERFDQNITDHELKTFLATEIEKILKPAAQSLDIAPSHSPYVILIVGVNGSGKTTTIGKLGQYWKNQGLRVAFAAADTFRAAAIEQLEIWANRLQIPLYKALPGTDPASLAFDALQKATASKDQILLIDTAGRLHTKTDLMAELAKIQRVLQKQDPTAPHSILLVLDATTGQNAHRQVDIFHNTVKLSGLIITKLDGTARGGVVVSLVEKFNLPIYSVGVGEHTEDLQPFQASDFAKGFLDL